MGSSFKTQTKDLSGCGYCGSYTPNEGQCRNCGAPRPIQARYELEKLCLKDIDALLKLRRIPGQPLYTIGSTFNID